MTNTRTKNPILSEIKKLYKWSFKVRGTYGELGTAARLRRKILELPMEGTLELDVEDGIYVFGQPYAFFDGGWIGTADLTKIKRVDVNTIEVKTTQNMLLQLNLSDYQN